MLWYYPEIPSALEALVLGDTTAKRCSVKITAYFNFCKTYWLMWKWLFKESTPFWISVFLVLCILQIVFKLAVENWDPPSTSQMANAPVLTPWKNWCVLVNASLCHCSPTGLEEVTEPSTGAGGAHRSGDVSTTKLALRGFSCSARMEVSEPTK